MGASRVLIFNRTARPSIVSAMWNDAKEHFETLAFRALRAQELASEFGFEVPCLITFFLLIVGCSKVS